MTTEHAGLSPEELAAEGATALPDKEVVSILDLNADVDLAIDAAAPIDLAVAANANVAAPIDAAVGANILSDGSTAQALTDQGVIIDQGIDADAIATSEQDSAIDQGNDVVDVEHHGRVALELQLDGLVVGEARGGIDRALLDGDALAEVRVVHDRQVVGLEAR